MNPVIPAARDHVGEYAPKISQYKIDPEKISEVIGKQGKTINGIIDETGVKISFLLGDADANIICFKLVYLLCCFLYRNVISI